MTDFERQLIQRQADQLLEHCGHCPEDFEDEAEQPECPACGGPGNILGDLGNRCHFRCRNCGMDFSREIARPQPAKPSSVRRSRRTPPPKAAFYPNDGGSGGGGGGLTST